MDLDNKIRKYLRIKRNDMPPYCGRIRSKRSNLINIFKMAGFKHGAEVGVNKGNHSYAICQIMPDINLSCIDTWTANTRRPDPEQQESAYQQAKKQLAPYNVKLIKDTSLNAVTTFASGSLDFVYIDANHTFDSCMSDLIAWAPKVKIGGIISGHDYLECYKYGVIEAVNTYTRAHNVNSWYIISNRQPTYFWVKKHND